MDKKDIDTLLEKWHETKQEISELEAKCEKYKKCCERIMNKQNTNSLSTKYFTLKRREITRNSLSRKNVPSDVWNRYAREHTYPVYYLTEKK